MDMDLYHLSIPPLCTSTSYKSMHAYGNYYRVKGTGIGHVITYNSDLLPIVHQQQSDLAYKECMLGYAGELVEILVLEYHPLSTSAIVMKGR